MKKQWINLLCRGLCVMMCVSAGCVTPPRNDRLPYGQLCTSKRIQKQQMRLNYSGVAVAVWGDYITVTVPVYPFFADKSDNINKDRAPALCQQIADLLKCYQKTAVQIVGYTDVFSRQDENIALSQQQAAKVSQCLWHAGLDARLLTAQGKGSSPISAGRHIIEIRTRRLP